MFFRKWFKKNKVEQNYEDTLKNNGVSSFDGEIKLLVIADSHGSIALKKENEEKLKNVDYDICCILGDVNYSDYDIILKYIPREKIVSILGNHDMFNVLSEHGLNNINGQVIEVNGIRIGAIQGSFRYKNERFPSFTHEESIAFLNSMPECDILLSHDKPYVCNNNDPVHDGLKGITKYLYEKKVPIDIHGHIHESYFDELKNGTRVKSVYGVELIIIKNGKIEKT